MGVELVEEWIGRSIEEVVAVEEQAEEEVEEGAGVEAVEGSELW